MSQTGETRSAKLKKWVFEVEPMPGDDFVVFPTRRPSRWVRIGVLFWASLSLLITPVQFGFYLTHHWTIMDYLGLILQIALLVECLTLFLLALQTKGWRFICVTGMLVMSFFSLIPWEVIAIYSGVESIRWCLWFRISRLRVVNRFFQELEEDTRIGYMVVRLLRMIILMVYFLHVGACIFAFFGSPSRTASWISSSGIEISWRERYMLSFYFSTVTAGTVGYGDLSPKTEIEHIFTIIFILCSVALTTYICGIILVLFMEMLKTSERDTYRGEMKKLDGFLREHHIEEGLQKAVKGHLQLQKQWKHFKDGDQEIIKFLPSALRAKVLAQPRLAALRQNVHFNNTSSDLLEHIASCFEEEIYIEGDVLWAFDSVYLFVEGSMMQKEHASELEKQVLKGDMLQQLNVSWKANALSRVLRMKKKKFRKIRKELVDVDVRPYSSPSLLHCVAVQGNVRCATALCEDNANAWRALDEEGLSPFFLALWFCRFDILNAFKSCGADFKEELNHMHTNMGDRLRQRLNELDISTLPDEWHQLLVDAELLGADEIDN